MKTLTSYFTRVCIGLAALSLGGAFADIVPPVKISVPPQTQTAVNGEVYNGVFSIEIGKAGVLSDFKIRGNGWTIVSADFPVDGALAGPGEILVPFQAIPTNADAPLALRFRHDGHRVKRSFQFGPAALQHATRPRTTRVIVPPSEMEDIAEHSLDEVTPPPSSARGGAIPLRFYGRFVYYREDGVMLGADSIRVWVYDDDGLASDPLVDEVIWEGKTDQNGYFDSGVIFWDDCDAFGCDDPDIYVHFECDTEVAQVQESGVLEEDYFWRTMDHIIANFTGSEVNFGTLAPGDPAEYGAVHIWNSIIRAHRFILDRAGVNLPIVDVQWPESEDGAYYTPFYEEIHVGPNRTWNEGTHTHEYGHHFLEIRAANPPANYCNGFCDGEGTGCDYDEDCPDESHCRWCPENATDAFNEGWPDWLGDVIPRDYPNHYIFDNGSPYIAYKPYDQEELDVCCVDGLSYDPTITEGFIAAVLRDIEDPDQDDHNGDGIRDLMCLGAEEILTVTDQFEPETISAFLTVFRGAYPQYTGDLWSTAFNVGGAAYVAGFPADSTPPGVVGFMNSSTHPLGQGGSLPCIRFEFSTAPDSGTGATMYSYDVTSNPAGIEPDEIPDPVDGAGECHLGGAVGVFQLGAHYISIKARDAAGHWSDNYATFGPFVIVDCNNSGVLDVCDINCCDAGSCIEVGPPWCLASAAICPPGSCGTSSDCNVNFIPDECDIASGTSEDCNGDGVPDECQPNLKHFTGAATKNWENAGNWLEGAIPVNGDHVCVSGSVPAGEVAYKQDYTRLATLNSGVDFTINSASPSPDLELDGPSFIQGDLAIATSCTLLNNDDLYVAGALNWAGGTIRNAGTTTVAGGLNLTSGTVTLGSNQHLILTDTDANPGTHTMSLVSGSKLTIGLGVTYAYTGDFRIFDGGLTTTIDVDGILRRTTGTSNIGVYSNVDNSGLIHNQTGGLNLFYGGTHSGFILSDPGTLLTLSNSHDLLQSSSLSADDLTLNGGTSFVRGHVNVGGLLTVDGGTWTFTNTASVASYGEDLFARTGIVRFQAPAAPAIDFDNVTVGQGLGIGGQAYFDTGAPVVMNSLNMVYGAFGGADPITINDSFTWTGGASFTAGGTITCNCPSTIQSTSSARYLLRQFNNYNYATFFGAFEPSTGGSYNNQATGTVELRGDSTGLTGGTSTNAGLIVKTVGTGRSTLTGMNNSGTIHAQTGEIYFYFNGSNSGDIIGDPGTLLTFDGSHEMSTASSLTADNLHITSNTANVRGDVNISGSVTMDSGTWTFTNEANVTSYGQNLSMTGGTLRFDAPVSGGSFNLNTVAIDSSTVNFNTTQTIGMQSLQLAGNIAGADPIVISGPFTWNRGDISAGGDLHANGPVTVLSTSSTRTLRRDMYNANTMTMNTGGVGLSNCDLMNLPTGTIDIITDGTKFSLATSATLYNEGVLMKSAGAGTAAIQNHFRNSGVVDVRTGTLEFFGGNSLTHIQTAGQTILNGGNINVTNPGVYTLQGGTLLGSGTVSGKLNNTAGRVQPGMSAGVITVSGTYTQGAAAALDIEIGGPNPGDFDTLNVTGAATLAGELHVAKINGYNPGGGASFVVLTASSINGAFATLTGAPGFSVSYTPTQVILTVSGSTLSGDLDGDCDVDIIDLATQISHYGIVGSATYAMGDLDGDGDVDIQDLAAMLSNYGLTC